MSKSEILTNDFFNNCVKNVESISNDEICILYLKELKNSISNEYNYIFDECLSFFSYNTNDDVNLSLDTILMLSNLSNLYPDLSEKLLSCSTYIVNYMDFYID